MSLEQFEAVAKSFITHYYGLFDSNQRGSLGALYQGQSMLTFENEKFQGPENIVKKLNSLAFQTVKHSVVTLDVQPTTGSGILVFVSGTLLVDGGEHPIKFSQVFNLLPIPGSNGYYVLNDLFRLNYG